jgi:hypothetical protein
MCRSPSESVSFVVNRPDETITQRPSAPTDLAIGRLARDVHIGKIFNAAIEGARTRAGGGNGLPLSISHQNHCDCSASLRRRWIDCKKVRRSGARSAANRVARELYGKWTGPVTGPGLPRLYSRHRDVALRTGRKSGGGEEGQAD